MSPRYILAFVFIIFAAVFSYGYITTRQPSELANIQTTPNDQASVQTATNQPQSDDDRGTIGGQAQTTGSTPSTGSGQAGTQTTYTMAQVATHKTTSSCWVAISGKVYDVTQWINNHPGGPGPILSLCGTDGTALFMGQHGSQGRPATELAKFQIGTLVQ